MSPIHITFATPTHPEFNWLDSFESLSIEELEGLILSLRVALAAFSTELSDRRKPWTDQALENYKEKLQKTAKQINEQGLTETHEGHLDRLKLSLAQAGCAQTERKESKPSKAGRQYLWLISNVIGWPYVLLIFCALGKHKVERLNEDQQVKLVKYIANYRESLFCCRLEERAIQCQFQEKHVNVDPPLTRGSKKRKRRESTGDAMNNKARDQQSVMLARASPQKLYRSDIRSPDPWVEAPACTTTLLQTGDPRSNEGVLSSQADKYISAGLAREDNFNRLSVLFCQRPYSAPIFMHVISGDIPCVYNIISQGGGSLWDHDPYGLGLLYYAAHYCWRGSGQECAMAMYSALLGFGISDGDFLWRTDEVGNQPTETINDWMLVSCAKGQSTGGLKDVLEEHTSTRDFTQLHRVLLNIDSSYGSLADYLNSLSPEELKTMIDVPDVRGRTPLAWAAEFGLPNAAELLLRFGAYPNQLRSTVDGGYSPLLHLAIAGPCSSWMDADVVETVRLLLQAGADPNGTDHEGWTPLHIAASWSLFNVTDMLQQCSQSLLNWQACTFTGESILDVCDNMDYKNRYGDAAGYYATNVDCWCYVQAQGG